MKTILPGRTPEFILAKQRWQNIVWLGGILFVLLAGIWAPMRSLAAAPASPARVLLLADSVYDRVNFTTLGPANFDPRNSLEFQIATSLGFIVDFAYNAAPSGVAFAPSGLTGTRRQWSTIPATLGVAPYGFADYRAVLLCDPHCFSSIAAFAAPTANAAVWGPTITGNTIFDGEDFDYHCPSSPGACIYLTNVFKYVTGGGGTCTNGTGLYVSLSCFYASAAPATPVPVLNYFGSFSVRGGGYNSIAITASHPALTALTSATLSGYSSSCHETFDTWPSGFLPLAIVTDPTAPKLYSGGSPLTNGAPYILARSCDGSLVPLGGTCCLNITNQAVDCVTTNKTYLWQFCVTNCSTDIIKYLTLPDMATSGVIPGQDVITLPTALSPGQGTCVSLYLTNSIGLTNLCFTVGAHSTNFFFCCSVTNCLKFAPCCVSFSSESLVPLAGSGCFTYTFSIKNDTQTVPLRYIVLVPDQPCVSFTPDILALTPPLLPGQSVVKSVKVCFTAPCKGPFCFQAGALDTNLLNCCSSHHCLPPASSPPIVIDGGLDGAVREAGTIPVPIVLDPSVVVPTRVTLFDGGAVVSSSQVTISNITTLTMNWNATGGTHSLIAEELDTLGLVWDSEPATVYVIDEQNPPGPAPVLAATRILDGNIYFSMQTVPGVTYQIECSDSIASPAWHLLQTIVGDGSKLTLNYSCSDAPQRFYRVQAH
jgi:hypothetical protein